MQKKPFDIGAMFGLIEEAIQPFEKAAMFALADEGYRTAFEQLLACMISIRTRDEVSLPTSRDLFAVARTAQAIAKLDVEEIDRMISASTFHRQKASQMKAIAERVVEQFGGDLPCDEGAILDLPGVGPKCANLVLGIAGGKAKVSVDIHVFRVVNRWGLVAESTPEKTMRSLQNVLPEEHWIDTNRLLMPFGRHLCTGLRPKCTGCPVHQYCRQVGVTEHR